MNKFKLTFFLFLLLKISHIVSQENLSERQLVNLDSLFTYCQESELYNGIVIITKGTSVLYEKSIQASPPIKDKTISAQSPFLLASISKQFTAMAIVHLHYNGLLDYDDLAKKYLSDFPYQEVTIRQLLNHTSGIKEYTGMVNKMYGEINAKYQQTGEIFTNQHIADLYSQHRPPLEFDSGSEFSYSNTGYIYLALLIEKISGVSFGEYLEKNFFKPLNMNNSFVLNEDKESSKEIIDSYKENYITSEKTIIPWPEALEIYGDGGIYSSIDDIVVWLHALESGKLFPADLLEEAYTAPSVNDKNLPYGFGWFVRRHPANNHLVVSHSGENLGYRHSVFRDLDNGLTYISLSNNSHDILGQLNSAVVRILFNGPFVLPKSNIEKQLTLDLLHRDIKEVKNLYNITATENKYVITENLINRIGYKMIEAKKKNIAKDIFLWNVELFPESSNVYDSLGEYFYNHGQERKALLNYKKALSLDPDNQRARTIILSLEKEGE